MYEKKWIYAVLAANKNWHPVVPASRVKKSGRRATKKRLRTSSAHLLLLGMTGSCGVFFNTDQGGGQPIEVGHGGIRSHALGDVFVGRLYLFS